MQWNTKRVTNLKTVEFNVHLVFIEFSSLQFKLLQRECLLGSAMIARLCAQLKFIDHRHLILIVLGQQLASIERMF